MYRLRLPLLLLVIIICLSCLTGPVIIVPDQNYQALDTKYLERKIRRMVRKYHLPAFAMTLVDNEEIIYQKANGIIDIENNIRASEGSVFKLWSVAKLFTGIEIFREIEEGLIDLDGTIFEYLPEFSIQSSKNQIFSIHNTILVFYIGS